MIFHKTFLLKTTGILLTILTTGISCIYGQITQPRSLRFTYTCYLTHLPADTKKLDCWIPIPLSDERQQIKLLSVNVKGGKFTTEPKYGNRMFYWQYTTSENPLADTIKIVLSYKIKLWEKSVPEAKKLIPLPKVQPDEKMQVYLTDNRLIPVQGPLFNLGSEMSLPDAPILAARQVYNNLIDRMVYNHKAPGAGIGDAKWACNSKTGDCSDYHSVFIGVCRSVGIPADHVFGIPLRNSQLNHTVEDWHCWARFWVKGPDWITIDASEADKHPEQKEYLFGSLSNTYLTISHGRDVILQPAQKGIPLNIFAEPYAEIDGKPLVNVKWKGIFEERKK